MLLSEMHKKGLSEGGYKPVVSLLIRSVLLLSVLLFVIPRNRRREKVEEWQRVFIRDMNRDENDRKTVRSRQSRNLVSGAPPFEPNLTINEATWDIKIAYGNPFMEIHLSFQIDIQQF